MKKEEYEELALEILDMLGVALHFAGAKKQSIEKLIDIYIQEVEQNDDDAAYDQEAIISLINQIKKKNPQFFD